MSATGSLADLALHSSDVCCGSWLRDNALMQFATVHDPVNVVRHGRSEQFFPVGRSGPSLSHRGECWASPDSRSAPNGPSTLTPYSLPAPPFYQPHPFR